MLKGLGGLWVVALGLLLGCRPASAQGTAADYERAATIGARLKETVFRDRITPRWDETGSRLWYRVRTGPSASEFVRVDAESGTKSAAFDAVRLAAALAKATGESVASGDLPVSALRYEDAECQLEFRFEGRRWKCDLSTYKLTEIAHDGDGAAEEPASDRSRRTGPETELVVVNRTAGPLRLVWVDLEGGRRPYGMIEPDATARQHTFGGHVWELVNAEGETVRRCEARDETTRIVIGSNDPKPVERPSMRRSGRSRNRDGGSSVSPGGVWSARLVDHNLIVREESSGEEFPLTEDGTAEDGYGADLHWSPDGRRLVAMREVKAKEHLVHLVESSPKDQVEPRLISVPYLKPGDTIARRRPRLFDIEAKREVPLESEALFDNPWSIDEVRWAADSSRFTFLYNQRGHQVLRVLDVDAGTGAVRQVVDERSATFIDYAGKTYAHWLNDGELLWMSERDGWNHLWLIDAESSNVKNQVTRGDWAVRRVLHVDDAERQVWFLAGGVVAGQDPYYLHLCRANLDGTGFVVLTEGDGTHEVEFSPDRRFFVDRWSRVDKPPVTELRASENGRLIVTLEEADSSLMEAAGIPRIERFTAPGRDGTTEIHGILVKPSTFDPLKRYPVLENVYAGPHDQHVPKAWGGLEGMRAMAELGFVVVMADGMGTNWRSKAFHDVCWKNLKDAGFADRLAWLKAAGASRPWLDLDRVGLYGGSAGGQNALRGLLDHGDFYKAAVADCGCHDNRMDKIWWNELWMGWPVGPEYAANSNVMDAGRLQGKLLLVVGELDRNVDPASTMQVVDALIRADKDFELLVIPGAGHGAAESAYGRRRRADFLVRHVMGVEPRRTETN